MSYQVFTASAKSPQICGELFAEDGRLDPSFRDKFKTFCEAHNYQGFISPIHYPDESKPIVNEETGEVTFELSTGEHKKLHYHFAIRSDKGNSLSYKYIVDFLESIQKDPANCLILDKGAEGFKAYAKYCVHLTPKSQDKQQFDFRDPSIDPAYGQAWKIDDKGRADDCGLINIYSPDFGYCDYGCNFLDLIKEPANNNSTRQARRDRHEEANNLLYQLTQEVLEKNYTRFSSFIRAQVAKNDPSLLGLVIKYTVYFKTLISDNVGSHEFENQARENMLESYKARSGDEYAYIDEEKARVCIKSESAEDRAGIVTSEETYDPETDLDLFAHNVYVATDLHICDEDVLAFLSHRLSNWLTQNFIPRENQYDKPALYKRYIKDLNRRVREVIDPFTLEVRPAYVDTFDSFLKAYKENRSDYIESKSTSPFGKKIG